MSEKGSEGGMEPIDVTGSLVKGTLLAVLIIAFLLIVYAIQKEGFSDIIGGIGNSFKSGFGWLK